MHRLFCVSTLRGMFVYIRSFALTTPVCIQTITQDNIKPETGSGFIWHDKYGLKVLAHDYMHVP